jgi:hypothetical protein
MIDQENLIGKLESGAALDQHERKFLLTILQKPLIAGVPKFDDRFPNLQLLQHMAEVEPRIGNFLQLNHAASIVAKIKADLIVRAVFDLQAAEPGSKLMESHVETIKNSHGVSRAYVFRALRQLDPERKRRMKQAAKVSRAVAKQSSRTE